MKPRELIRQISPLSLVIDVREVMRIYLDTRLDGRLRHRAEH